MKILICKQGQFGGTDKLLNRFYEWLISNDYSVDLFHTDLDGTESLKEEYDLSVLPSSQLGDLDYIRKQGITIKRLLIWIMGMGSFSDSYYNCPAKSIIDKFLYFFYRKEANNTLKWLICHDAIIFTDSVGIYNTLRNSMLSIGDALEKQIVPIAIDCPRQNKWIINHYDVDKEMIRVSWVGRVSNDFKKIPLLHLLNDLEKCVEKHNLKIELTIVGDGDAVGFVREIAEEISFPVVFINNIPYDKLSDYFIENVDLLIAMGTSALDGAKVGCPTAVITPVRSMDPERVEYRWIYDSIGFSLGEFPDIDIETGQVRVSLETIIGDYLKNEDISEKCFDYSQKFNSENVFNALIQRDLPKMIDDEMQKHITVFSKMKRRKNFVKKLLNL